ncbi:hypothetical protein [Halovivax sp.]|uniref:hypothetical protein n=1 Tax=Halovivax sp. TaxID=1935978 RepID=UPI0025BCA577|nr:hypothetical protein [Halovivax sp.]
MNDHELVDVDVSGTTLQATDVASNVVAFDITGWDRLSEPKSFDEPIDSTAAGRVSELRYDLRNYIGIERLDGPLEDGPDASNSRNIAADEDVRFDLPAGEYFCRLEADILTRLRFDGEATVRNRPYGPLVLSFPHPTPVTFGFKTTFDYPRDEIAVEPTVDGIARAVSHLSASVRTTSPDRVHRNYRGYPPLLALEEETHVPEVVRDATAETGLELVVPDRLEAVFPSAPLSYYLSAVVIPADVETPALRAPSLDLVHEFPELPAFGRSAGELLRRTFFLDLLTSWVDDNEPTVAAHDRVASAGIDLGPYADAPIAERVAAYLDFPDEVVDEVLPEWPYRMTVDPAADHATVLPHLLHDLAAIDVPGTESGVPGARNFEPSHRSDRPPAVRALTSRSRIVGSIGRGANPEGFEAPPVAYENRLSYLDQDADALSVAIVLGDGATVDGDAIAAAYVERDEHVSPIVDVVESPTRAELSALFAEGVGYLHFVGDGDGRGLACADGSLRVADIDENNVQVVQLDALDSRAVAESLIDRGSVAAAIRPNATHADGPSTTMGELLLYGHSVATAAACGALGDSDCAGAVVGDGSHRFVAKWRPTEIQALVNRDDEVSVSVVPFPVDPVGAHWVGKRDVPKALQTETIQFELDPTEISGYFPTNKEPVYFEDRFYWMDEQGQLIYPIS